MLMAFTLVAGAEHYIVDILLGWAFAAGVHIGWLRLDDRRARRRAAAAAEAEAEAEPDLVTV
jgi:membrane-associated phospholipid phosphatase